MKYTQNYPFHKNYRRLLQFGLFLLAILFIIGFTIFMNKKTIIVGPGNNTVYLQDSKLYVFDDVYSVRQYPDRISIHYPYLLIVQAGKPLTTIYNLETKHKEKEIHDIVLDYYQGNIVYNRKTSYYNNMDLNKYCESAFIKSTQEVLCIAHDNENSVNNELYRIKTDNPKNWKQLYNSKRILTTVAVINNYIYVGEIDFKTKENYITINDKSIPVENVVSIIYQMNNNPYFASLKSNFNSQKENYYIIKGSTVEAVSDKKIIFYQP